MGNLRNRIERLEEEAGPGAEVFRLAWESFLKAGELPDDSDTPAYRRVAKDALHYFRYICLMTSPRCDGPLEELTTKFTDLACEVADLELTVRQSGTEPGYVRRQARKLWVRLRELKKERDDIVSPAIRNKVDSTPSVTSA